MRIASQRREVLTDRVVADAQALAQGFDIDPGLGLQQVPKQPLLGRTEVSKPVHG